MPVVAADLLVELQERTIDLVVDPDKLLPALVDAFAIAQHEAKADWEADLPVMPSIARTIVLRGARSILVNPDRNSSEQAGDHLVQASGAGDIFSTADLTRLRGLRSRSRVGSIRMSAAGLAESYPDRFLNASHYLGDDHYV